MPDWLHDLIQIISGIKCDQLASQASGHQMSINTNQGIHVTLVLWATR